DSRVNVATSRQNRRCPCRPLTPRARRFAERSGLAGRARVFHQPSAAARDRAASTSLPSVAVLDVAVQYACGRLPSRALYLQPSHRASPRSWCNIRAAGISHTPSAAARDRPVSTSLRWARRAPPVLNVLFKYASARLPRRASLSSLCERGPLARFAGERCEKCRLSAESPQRVARAGQTTPGQRAFTVSSELGFIEDNGRL